MKSKVEIEKQIKTLLEKTGESPYSPKLKMRLCGDMAKRGYRGTIQFSQGITKVYVYYVNRFNNVVDYDEWSVDDVVEFIVKKIKYLL